MSSLQIALDEPLSPELALVCPELAERARALLPDRVFEAPPAEAGLLRALVLAVAALLVTVTPLALIVLAAPPRP
jgi:hypothetical protein